jgi:hypothetical protein
MPSRTVTLEVAAFLDSPQAQALAGLPPTGRRTLAERFLTCVHEDLGRPPGELDGEALGELLARALPARFGHKDPLAASLPAFLEAYLAHLGEVAVVTHAFELQLALDAGLDAFASAVADPDTPRGVRKGEQQPFTHGASKTGRNDPCPCGSGKKFKQCHGKQR